MNGNNGEGPNLREMFNNTPVGGASNNPRRLSDRRNPAPPSLQTNGEEMPIERDDGREGSASPDAERKRAGAGTPQHSPTKRMPFLHHHAGLVAQCMTVHRPPTLSIMPNWSKQESMAMMRFLIDEAETINKKCIPYGGLTIINTEFPRDLIPGREPSELKEKARYLLNEEVQNFHTFPLEDRIWCLHVFKVYMNHKMQEAVISSDSFHNVRKTAGSLSLELDGGTLLMFYTRPANDTTPDDNMETIWSDAKKEKEAGKGSEKISK
ncbi:hypothetical protein CAEBREN_06789 [Caenorhabditis brenneri]|uniref:SPK domain-containing protein n=1 Tax=Caenorhabditis brenneri TaxID=135651 RepID=G0NDE6_CAEBE|nr:hypothetical protein CAEBREN_06789 [Caenorhabditis brenneri]